MLIIYNVQGGGLNIYKYSEKQGYGKQKTTGMARLSLPL